MAASSTSHVAHVVECQADAEHAHNDAQIDATNADNHRCASWTLHPPSWRENVNIVMCFHGPVLRAIEWLVIAAKLSLVLIMPSKVLIMPSVVRQVQPTERRHCALQEQHNRQNLGLDFMLYVHYCPKDLTNLIWPQKLHVLQPGSKYGETCTQW